MTDQRRVAFDEGGDLVECGEPDRDRDLYLADWQTDGTIDVALDYIDHNVSIEHQVHLVGLGCCPIHHSLRNA